MKLSSKALALASIVAVSNADTEIWNKPYGLSKLRFQTVLLCGPVFSNPKSSLCKPINPTDSVIRPIAPDKSMRCQLAYETVECSSSSSKSSKGCDEPVPNGPPPLLKCVDGRRRRNLKGGSRSTTVLHTMFHFVRGEIHGFDSNQCPTEVITDRAVDLEECHSDLNKQVWVPLYVSF